MNPAEDDLDRYVAEALEKDPEFRAAYEKVEARETRPPAKKWRVQGPNLPEDYRSQSAAYDAVNELAGFGHPVTVHHWENGRWGLYEKINPDRNEEDPAL